MPSRFFLISFVTGIAVAIAVAIVLGRPGRGTDARAGVYVATVRDTSGARELAAAEHSLAAARSAKLAVLAEYFAAERRRGAEMPAEAVRRNDTATSDETRTAGARDTDAIAAALDAVPPVHDDDGATPDEAAMRDDEHEPTTARATTAAARKETAAPAPRLDGEWIVSNAVESTRDRRLKGAAFEYLLRLRQERDRIEGRGSRVAKNGKTLPRAHQTPVSVSGTMRDGRVELRFSEHGGRGTREGRFIWDVTSNDRLSGSFASEASGTLGRSEARRVVD